MSERGNFEGNISEILNKAEKIPGLSEDERDYAYRTYRLLYNARGYMLAPTCLGILFALTGCFFTAVILSAIFGPSDPRLMYMVPGSLIVYFAISAAFLRMGFYDKLLKAEISGFKYSMQTDPKIMPVLELIKINDPKTVKKIDKYLFS